MMNKSKSEQARDLSVILCTWNNSKRLAITLDAIAECEIPECLQWELIVVNNICTDDTDAVVASFTDQLPINYVHEPKQGLSNARNAGLAAAAGEWVLFTDDDVRPYPQWVAAYWEVITKQGGEYFFGGPVESEFEGDGLPREIRKFAPASVKGFDWGPYEHEPKQAGNFLSANWCSRTDQLVQSGGFNPEMGLGASEKRIMVGEETDLMIRLKQKGLKPWYVPRAKIRHFVPADKCKIEHLSGRYGAWVYQNTNAPKSIFRFMYHATRKTSVDLWKAINLRREMSDAEKHMIRIRLKYRLYAIRDRMFGRD